MKQTIGLYIRYRDNEIKDIENFNEFLEIHEEDDEVRIGHHDHPIEFTFDDCFLYPIDRDGNEDRFDYIRTEADFLELFRDFASNGPEYLDSLPLETRISDIFNNSDYSVEELKQTWQCQ